MREKERSNSKKAVGSPHFLASLALICAGILFYMALSHLSDLLNVFRQQGMIDALDLRERAPEMDGTGLINEEEKIPGFDPNKDYSGWKAGQPVTRCCWTTMPASPFPWLRSDPQGHIH